MIIGLVPRIKLGTSLQVSQVDRLAVGERVRLAGVLKQRRNGARIPCPVLIGRGVELRLRKRPASLGPKVMPAE